MKALLTALAAGLIAFGCQAQSVSAPPFSGVAPHGVDALAFDPGALCFAPSVFCVAQTTTAPSGGQGFVDYTTLSSIGDASGYFAGAFAPSFSGTGGTEQELVGSIFAPTVAVTGTFDLLWSIESGPGVSSGIVTDLREFNIEGGVSGTGGVTIFKGIEEQLFLAGSGNIGEYDAWRDDADDTSGGYSGTITTERGIHQVATNHPNDLASSLTMVAAPFKLASTVVGSLPTCNAGAAGELFYVTDALTPAYNVTLTGGSSGKAIAMCDGTNWTAH